MRPRLIALLVAGACTGAPVDSAAPGADSATAGDDTADPCDGAPELTWANFGEGFLLAHCQGCHAGSAPDRHDAPEQVTFDSAEQAWYWAPRILARATGDAPTMPPMGGTDADDRQRLWWWLTCGTPGT